jgi:hypothetical protein
MKCWDPQGGLAYLFYGADKGEGQGMKQQVARADTAEAGSGTIKLHTAL